MGMMGLALMAGPAAAACLEDCKSACSMDPQDAQACVQSCLKGCGLDAPEPEGAAATPGKVSHYGAIAISPGTMEYGVVSGFLTQREAENRAMAICREENAVKPPDCRIGVWFRSSCAALAVNKSGDPNNMGWAAQWAAGKDLAEERALEKCNAHTLDKQCKVVASICAE